MMSSVAPWKRIVVPAIVTSRYTSSAFLHFFCHHWTLHGTGTRYQTTSISMSTKQAYHSFLCHCILLAKVNAQRCVENRMLRGINREIASRSTWETKRLKERWHFGQVRMIYLFVARRGLPMTCHIVLNAELVSLTRMPCSILYHILSHRSNCQCQQGWYLRCYQHETKRPIQTYEQ